MLGQQLNQVLGEASLTSRPSQARPIVLQPDLLSQKAQHKLGRGSLQQAGSAVSFPKASMNAEPVNMHVLSHQHRLQATMLSCPSPCRCTASAHLLLLLRKQAGWQSWGRSVQVGLLLLQLLPSVRSLRGCPLSLSCCLPVDMLRS